jgi:hypothetical protein
VASCCAPSVAPGVMFRRFRFGKSAARAKGLAEKTLEDAVAELREAEAQLRVFDLVHRGSCRATSPILRPSLVTHASQR